MATKNPNDKYAFLFSGPTGERELKDLKNVSEVLVEYYNYPISQVKIVLGSTPTVMPTFSGVTAVVVASQVQLESQLTTFTTMAAGANKTVLLYFAGWGTSESGISKLAIDNAAPPTYVDPTWLTARLNAFGAAQVNVVMQQNNCGGFSAALTGCTLTDWTFTFACSTTESSYGDPVMGSYFTHAWTRGLKLQALPAFVPPHPDSGKYADQLAAGAEGTNLLVSLEEAEIFGKLIHDLDSAYAMAGFSTPGYLEPVGGSPQYLGLPDLLIRDGSPQWYESLDITLTHPNHPGVDADPANKDLYIADSPPPPPPPGEFNNTVNVNTRNLGTHPVRVYSLAMDLFWSGGGGAGTDPYDICDIVPAGGVLKPIDPADIDTADDIWDTHSKNIKFENTSTHRCIKVEAERLCICPGGGGAVEVVDCLDHNWHPQSRENEGQRNIDIMTMLTSLPLPIPFPGIMGIKKHIYALKNPFAQPRNFYIVFPENYFKYKNKIQFNWYEVTRDKKAEQIPLTITMEPHPHIAMRLKEGEEKKILFSAKLNAEFALNEDVVLPFDILVEHLDIDDDDVIFRKAAVAVQPNAVAFAGFTVVIKKGAGIIKGVVLDRDGNFAAGAKVFLRTINDLQGAVVKAGKDGTFDFKTINADVYKVIAEGDGWRSKEKIIALTDGRVDDLKVNLIEPFGDEDLVKVVIDKIRILDDNDPCIKGKGELTFTSVVVPDNDTDRKQVVRLPEVGVYHVGDKPGKNDIELRVTVFQGVVKNKSLSFTISGKEIDLFDPDDELARYHREFAGDPAQWYGKYYPGDEYLDAEDVGDWAIWYRILRG